MSNKYVLQYGSLAGWPFALAEGLNEIGVKSFNVINENSDVEDLDRQLPCHRFLYLRHENKYIKLLKRFSFFGEVVRDCSLVHYHGGIITTLDGFNFHEGRTLAALKIPTLMSFGGGDARITELACRNNPYFHLYREPSAEHDAKVIRYLRKISKYIKYAATDCEMSESVAPYFEKVFDFKQPINLSKFIYERVNIINRPPMFLHIPTHPKAKGTAFIVAAVERLRSERFNFEFKMVRQLTQIELINEIKACDVYIDEMLNGSHGMTAVEAMALGKPTVTYIREDLVEKYPKEMPIINANPDTIYSVMKKLIQDRDLISNVSAKSREYVEMFHDHKKVANVMAKVYSNISPFN